MLYNYVRFIGLLSFTYVPYRRPNSPQNLGWTTTPSCFDASYSHTPQPDKRHTLQVERPTSGHLESILFTITNHSLSGVILIFIFLAWPITMTPSCFWVWVLGLLPIFEFYGPPQTLHQHFFNFGTGALRLGGLEIQHYYWHSSTAHSPCKVT